MVAQQPCYKARCNGMAKQLGGNSVCILRRDVFTVYGEIPGSHQNGDVFVLQAPDVNEVQSPQLFRIELWTPSGSEKNRASREIWNTLNYFQQKNKWASWLSILVQPMLHIKPAEDSAFLRDGFGCEPDLSFDFLFGMRLREGRLRGCAQFKSQFHKACAWANFNPDGIGAFKK